MSSAVCERNDGFLLYMFEEDLKMIEKWATEYKEQNNGDIPCYGDMYGLWTNSRNPVVHVILQGKCIPADDYLFLQSPQFQNNTAKSMFSYIGCWSFEKPTKRYYQYMMDMTSTNPPRVIFLEVEHEIDSLAFHPILFTDCQKENGMIESLKGRNPFRLPDEPSSSLHERENVEEEKKEGVIATIVDALSDKIKTLMDRNSSQESASYASAVKQGNQDHTSKVSDLRQDDHETPASSNLLSQDVQDVLNCTKRNQWYLTTDGQEMLQVISSKLKELINQDPKISRDNDTHNAMILFSFEKNYVISFPPNFPSDIPVQLYCQTTSRTGRSYASPVTELKSRDPLQLVEKIFAAL